MLIALTLLAVSVVVARRCIDDRRNARGLLVTPETSLIRFASLSSNDELYLSAAEQPRDKRFAPELLCADAICDKMIRHLNDTPSFFGAMVSSL